MPELTLDTYPGALSPFARSAGPQSAQIALVGEALGADEDAAHTPFIGASGQELTRMLREAGIDRRQCFVTNTFAFRPKANNIELMCVKKAEAGAAYDRPPLRQGKYIHPMLFPELERLHHELETVAPNLVVALGGIASWALLDRPAIGAIRGTVAPCIACPGLKVLPTFHPAAVLRNWAQRPIVVADLMKASREALFPEIRRPERYVLVSPTLSEISEWCARPADLLACDIETSRGQITMIGFARSVSDAIVIPFVDMHASGGSHWATPREELQAWHMVQGLLEGPVPKVFQNGLYDLQYIARMGFRPRGLAHDTMLFHHALFPELQKGLGFMGSLFTDEPAWKLMRKGETYKRDE